MRTSGPTPQVPVHLAVVLGVCGLVVAQASGLIVGGGGGPMTDPGWPSGVLQLANLPSRVSWWEGPPFGGGEYHFQYTCKGADEFNEALKLLAAIQIPKMTRTNLSTTGDTLVESQDRLAVLVVHEGPSPQQQFGQPADKKSSPITWTFTIWSPGSWYHLFNHPKSFWNADHANFRQPVPVPAIDVYVGKDSPIEWAKVKVPQNVRVVDKRGKTSAGQTAQGGVFHGNVYDIMTHKPIDDVEIILEPLGKESGASDKRKGLTDQQGRFRIDKIPAGTFKVLAVEGANYVSRQAGTCRNEGGTEMEAVVFLSPKAAITGTVVDVDGKPIRGVKISASQVLGIDGLGYSLQSEVSDTTDEDGLFELTGLPKGCVNLRCSAESMYQKASFELYDVPSDAITITMTHTGTVRGKVSFGSRPPKEGVHVHICPVGGQRRGTWGGGAKCEPGGSFEFKGVPPGEYWVSTNPAILHGDETGAEKVTVKAGETAEVKLNHEERSGRSGKSTIMGPSKIAPPTTLPAVLGSPPYLLKSKSAAPSIVVYYCAAGMRRPSSDKLRKSSVIVEVWPDGQIAWSEDLVHGGPPYRKGSVKPERIAAVIESLAKDRVFDDAGLSRGYSGPDSDYLVIRVFDGSKQVQLASWHELFESKPNLVVTSKGVESLNQRNRSEVLAAEPKDYRRFREVWDRIRQEARKMTAEAGDIRPIAAE